MSEKSEKAMIVAGVMSGTSADGIDVAIVRIGETGVSTVKRASGSADELRGRGRPYNTIKLLGHAEYSYPAKVRAAVLAAMNAESARAADLARLNFLLGELYAEAVLSTERQFCVKAELGGWYGQT